MASDRHLARLMDGAAAWNLWRREEPLVRPDLQGLSLTLAQKQWGQTSGGPINFAQSMLREADLRHATLIDADLSNATLVGADLSGARMRNADLRNANVSLARFEGTDLEGAQFTGANLAGADLSGARNLSLHQVEGAHGDAKTLLPQQLVAPAAWRNGTVAETRTAVSAEMLKAPATTEAYFPSVLRSRKPESDPFVDRFGRALRGLPRPRLDTVADHARHTLKELPRPRVGAVTDRAKAAFQGLPRPRIGARVGAMADRAKAALQSVPRPNFVAVADRARRAVQSLPRPRPAHLANRAKLALSGLPHPGAIAIAGITGLVLVFGFGGLLALRALENRGVDADAGSVPVIVAQEQAGPEREAAPSAPAPTLALAPEGAPKQETIDEAASEIPEPAVVAAPPKEEPPQRLTVAEAEQPAPVEEVEAADDAATVARVEERPAALTTEPVPAVPTVPEGASGIEPHDGSDAATPTLQDLSEPSGNPTESQVRLAFAMRADDAAIPPEKPLNAPIVGGEAQAFIESYLGKPATTRALDDKMERTDLPTPKSVAKPTTLAKATPEALQALDAPTSVIDYLSMPNKSSDWIEVFIKNFYLSGETLDEADLRRIYSPQVEYFGTRKTSLAKVAREKAQYYRDWPRRHYELVPGSIDIKWKSAQVADVSFTYDYKVSAPKKKKTSKGRGRAFLTFDLRGHTGLIVREDGEVIAHN